MGRLKKTGYYKNVYFNNIVANAVDELTNLGQEMANKAIQEGSRGYNNVLYNLYDSIGSAVYHNGKLIKSSIRFADTRKKSKGEAREGYTGREAIREFFKVNQTITTKNSLHLMIVAAMPYAEYLEKGTFTSGDKKRQIRVISQITSELESRMHKYGRFNPKLIQVAGGNIL